VVASVFAAAVEAVGAVGALVGAAPQAAITPAAVVRPAITRNSRREKFFFDIGKLLLENIAVNLLWFDRLGFVFSYWLGIG